MNTVLIKNKYFRIIYLITLAGLCFWGMLETFDGTAGMFMYFTYISNALVLLMTLSQMVILFFNIGSKRQKEHKLQIPPVLVGVVLMCISFTFLTVFFVLNPFQMPKSWQDAVVHYIVPIVTVLEFILFQEHGRFKKHYPLFWGLAPVTYYGYVWTLRLLGFRFGNGAFPYFFMDHVKYGWGFVFKMSCLLLVAFLVLGYLICWMDKLLAHDK